MCASDLRLRGAAAFMEGSSKAASNAGLASGGMSREKVERRVAGMKHEWCSACTRRICRDWAGDAILLGSDSCASSMAES